VRATLFMLGPAFVASIAYVDPGNFATNVQGGAQFGYLLLWVVLAANLVAMVIQYLSAKLGIVTDHNYPEVVREHFPRAFTWGCGCRPRSWRCRPTSPSSSAPRSG
jgi:manganese transport protein